MFLLMWFENDLKTCLETCCGNVFETVWERFENCLFVGFFRNVLKTVLNVFENLFDLFLKICYFVVF